MPGGKADDSALHRIRAIAEAVVVPDISPLTLGELGVVREVKLTAGKPEVVVSPPEPKNPLMHLIAMNIEVALEGAGFGLVRVTTSLVPAWNEEWISDKGRAKIAKSGQDPLRPLKTGRRLSTKTSTPSA